MHGDDCVALNALIKDNVVTLVQLGCTECFFTRLADLVAMPGGPHLIPFRTQSLSPPGPMVLCLKAWESRSPPGLLGAWKQVSRTLVHNDGFGRDVLGRVFRGRFHIRN